MSPWPGMQSGGWGNGHTCLHNQRASRLWFTFQEMSGTPPRSE
jgi:hypothetical protein